MEAFPGATGRGVRVAVIDSGVNPSHPHIGGVAGGIAIGAEVRASDYLDLVGHGTAVMAAIKEKAPDAEYFAVRVFHKSLRTNLDSLLQAIDWCVEQRIGVINLSLGTTNAAHTQRFAAAIANAAANGVILVSPRDVDGTPALPGSMPGVIGVCLNWDWPRESYECRLGANDVEFYASGYPRSLPTVPRERNLHGISFAAANMSGFVVRACQGLQNLSYSAVHHVLVAEGERLSAASEPLHTLSEPNHSP